MVRAARPQTLRDVTEAFVRPNGISLRTALSIAAEIPVKEYPGNTVLYDEFLPVVQALAESVLPSVSEVYQLEYSAAGLLAVSKDELFFKNYYDYHFYFSMAHFLWPEMYLGIDGSGPDIYLAKPLRISDIAGMEEGIERLTRFAEQNPDYYYGDEHTEEANSDLEFAG